MSREVGLELGDHQFVGLAERVGAGKARAETLWRVLTSISDSNHRFHLQHTSDATRR